MVIRDTDNLPSNSALFCLKRRRGTNDRDDDRQTGTATDPRVATLYGVWK